MVHDTGRSVVFGDGIRGRRGIHVDGKVSGYIGFGANAGLLVEFLVFSLVKGGVDVDDGQDAIVDGFGRFSFCSFWRGFSCLLFTGSLRGLFSQCCGGNGEGVAFGVIDDGSAVVRRDSAEGNTRLFGWRHSARKKVFGKQTAVMTEFSFQVPPFRLRGGEAFRGGGFLSLLSLASNTILLARVPGNIMKSSYSSWLTNSLARNCSLPLASSSSKPPGVCGGNVALSTAGEVSSLVILMGGPAGGPFGSSTGGTGSSASRGNGNLQ